MWHRAKHGTCSPRGHLQRVITPGSRRDNIQSQLSSYTQVCRQARLSADLRTQQAARWFLTRGWWQGGNLQFSLRVFSSLGAELQPGVGAETTGTLSCPYLDFLLLSLCEEKKHMDWVTGHNRRFQNEPLPILTLQVGVSEGFASWLLLCLMWSFNETVISAAK